MPTQERIKMSELRFNLGGLWTGDPVYKTVNLAEVCDIHADIMNLDTFCKDETVDEFFLSHTIEHIPITEYSNFILNMKKKLKPGGIIRVQQTDSGKIIKMWTDGQISFRSMRTMIFTPANRCSGNMLQQHQSMWSEEELIRDFESFGFECSTYDAGVWNFDMKDDIIESDTNPDFGKQIPNLGVIAKKI